MEENNKRDLENKQLKSGSLMDKKLNRRGFLKASERVAGLLAGIGFLGPFSIFGKDYSEKSINSVKVDSKEFSNPTYPFKLGVASGDPLSDGVVLWTRLAPNPLVNGGGMSHQPVKVFWEISEDESFRNIIKQGTEIAEPSYAHSVHAEVEGLAPDTWYYYRFKAEGQISPTGRTKTAPALGADLEQLNFAFLSCQNYTAGYYTAYEHLIKEDLDVVLFLGDYIYEDKGAVVSGRRHIPFKNIFSLEEYRIRYGQYKSNLALQAAHAAFPWIVTPDDHEVENDWGGDDKSFNTENFLARRAAALQAYYEHMPLRKSSRPENIYMSLYRKYPYGNLAEFNVLDTRQYRSGPACGGGNQSLCEERMNPFRTMLGDEQEKWLFNNLKSSKARWNIIAQQVMVAQRDRAEGEAVRLHMDKWDGYVATRNKLFNCIKEKGINNLVILTGDQHSNWVNDLKEDFNNPNSKILATEIVGTSISSGGNGSDFPTAGKVALSENPHIKFMNAQRGYVRCNLTKERWQTDFRIVPFIDKQGAPISTRASFVVEKGKPGAVEV
jgi:alkaline phosphatase D